MIRLIFHAGPQAGIEVATGSPRIRFGRHPDENDFVLTEPVASSKHCRLIKTPQGPYVLEDVGSKNGTFVNGQRIERVVLASGDRFMVGSTEIEVQDGRARLAVTSSSQAGREIPIGSEPIRIGRAPDNDFEIKDPKSSGYHCAILVLPMGFALQDNGSSNGTFVNGQRIQRHMLVDGDVITIGDTEIRFLIDELDLGQEQSQLDPTLSGQPQHAAGGSSMLAFVSGPHAGLSIPLGTDPITLGRRPECTFVLADVQVSGNHCAITPNGLGGYVLTDLRSSNGTSVNGQKIPAQTPIPLNPGDLVSMGESVAEVKLGAAASQVRIQQAPAQAGTEVGGVTVMAEGAYVLPSQPKFVLNGQVLPKDRISIGRSPACDIFLEEDEVSREHAVIYWDGDGFTVEDKSKAGTFVSDRRVVKEKLQTGHVLKITPHMYNVTIRGDRCALEEIDTAAALAAIEVARETQFAMKQVAAQETAGGGGGGGAGGYKTMYKMAIPNVEAAIQEKKAKYKKKGAPMWRPTSDIQPQRVRMVAVSTTIAAAAAICVYLYSTSGDAALLNHPLSVSHSSQEFKEWGEKNGLPGGCGNCHSIGRGVDDQKCAECHDQIAAAARPQHMAATSSKAGMKPPHACEGCHQEHRNAQHNTVLEARGGCMNGMCHADAHEKDLLAAAKAPDKQSVSIALDSPQAQKFFEARGSLQERLHISHAVKGVQCSTCHGGTDAGGKAVCADARKACFKCHQAGPKLKPSMCRACHVEHATSREDAENCGAVKGDFGIVSLTRLPDGDPKLESVHATITTASSALKGGALALLGFLPLGVVAVYYRARMRRRAETLVKKLHEIPAESVKRLVHSINPDKCVGCSMCVQACPASVLELVHHKSTVVNFDSCIQCKKCEGACNFDALRMHDADKPPPMIEMPDLDAHYQTPVAGMYLIGQAAGTPQVKNASNLGRMVIDHMVQNGYRPGAGRAAGAEVDVAVIGSGPAGLSAALSCLQQQMTYVCLEKQRDFSATIRNYYHKGKEVMAEPNDVQTLGHLPVWDSVREALLGKWKELIDQYRMNMQYEANVTAVKKEGEVFVITVSDAKGKEKSTVRAGRVVLAIGTMGNPRKLRCPGDDLPKVLPSLVDQDEYNGKNCLVVGGTDSAIEVALALSSANGGSNKVWISCRGQKFDRVKPKNLERIMEAIKAGKVLPLFATTTNEVKEGAVVMKHGDGRLEELPNDVTFAMIGGDPPIKFLQGIGVPYTQKPHSWSPGKTDELVKRVSKT